MSKPSGKLAFAYRSIANLEQKVSDLAAENERLRAQVAERDATIEEWSGTAVHNAMEVDRLNARIAELESGTVDPADVCALGQECHELRAENERLHKTFDDMCRKAAYWAGKAAELERDAERYRWLTDDHESREQRVARNDLCTRLPVMSYSTASAAIDAALSAQGSSTSTARQEE